MTTDAQRVLANVVRMNQSFGKTLVAKVLKGSRDASVQKYAHLTTLPTFGLMKERTIKDISRFIDYLTADGYLRIEGGEFPVLKLTDRGVQVLKGQLKVTKRVNQQVIAQRQTNVATDGLKLSDEDNQLFAKLKMKRLALAREAGLPPFMIFSDKTLMNMAVLRPKTADEFLAISGVGEKKFEIYHDDFAAVLAEA